jgi:circadian clock protein KaiC
MTAMITGEGGDGTLTRYGLEEYVADCVIVLDQRVQDQIATRRLRVVKYRGTVHGTNEYPFVIGERGISVLPITSLQLDHRASRQRIPTGIAQLDALLGGKGVFRGSSVLVSGSPGTGKSSIASAFLLAACRRGERAMLFAYEESSAQVLRNMASVGLDLTEWLNKGLLRIVATRPTLHGLEQHLVLMHDAIGEFSPSAVAVDPITNLSLARDQADVKPTLMRLIDFIKQRQITAFFTSLANGGAPARDDSEVGVSSLMDTWLQLRNVEFNGERNRLLHILKSRGMAHSNQVREFVLSDEGLSLVEVYAGADRVLTGTARVAQEGLERSASAGRREEHQHRLRQLATRQQAIEAQIALLRAQSDAEAAEVKFAVKREAAQSRTSQRDAEMMAALRSDGRPTNRRTRRSK